jgi:hypothetical protein
MMRQAQVFLLFASAAMLTVSSGRAEGPTADACATASDNAQPLRKAGKLRAAKQQLLICVTKSCPSIVRDDCAGQLGSIEKAMPTVVFVATDAKGGDLSAVHVSMDGQPLADHLDGTPLAVDPGEHMFRFDATGLPSVNKKVVLHETEKERRVALSFSLPSEGPAPAEGSSTPQSEESAAAPTPWPAYVAFGIGGAGLVVGVIFTVSALMQNSLLAGECTLPNGGCDSQYQPQIDRLHTDQILAGVGYGIAVVGAGVGTYLLLTSGSSQQKANAVRAPSLQLVPRIGLGWFGVGGRF